jgi:hypothetical protein
MFNQLNSILREENVLIGGGAVLCAMRANCKCQTSDCWWGERSDIDLFVYNVTTRSEASTRIVQRIWLALAVDLEQWIVVRGRGVIKSTS